MADPQKTGDSSSAGTAVDDAARFEFDKDLENRKLALEERKLEQARADSRARVWSTILVSGLATLVVAVYTTWTNTRAKERADRTEQTRVAIELVNARE